MSADDSALVKVIQGGLVFDDVVYLYLPRGMGGGAVQSVIARGVELVGDRHGNPSAKGAWIAASIFAAAVESLATLHRMRPDLYPPNPVEGATLSASTLRGWAGADEWVVDVPGRRVGVRPWDSHARGLGSVAKWVPMERTEAVRALRVPLGRKENRVRPVAPLPRRRRR